ncbi:hypothetical protein HCA78_02395 [Listeria booriae]|uniref:Uncharacterized protein n=1 Tax=Listeria booriae TaxID=1552123 RepID=A0A7X0XQ69_9LIST|nr:hypothetical protein [Listeria booriae]MBC1227595.1 hypothetical protein [Listeria booriae]MBC1778673.1 hypothetical protein [Listeria booriae]MBC2002602.1 hypothetical protein [Listeria booriae]MBC2327246.1 hypothetical protein [Listeria booriae]
MDDNQGYTPTHHASNTATQTTSTATVEENSQTGFHSKSEDSPYRPTSQPSATGKDIRISEMSAGEMMAKISDGIESTTRSIEGYLNVVQDIKAIEWTDSHRDAVVAFLEKDVQVMQKALLFVQTCGTFLQEATDEYIAMDIALATKITCDVE